MKSNIFVLKVFLFIFGTQNMLAQEKIISIEKIEIKGSSIRAIELLNDSTVVFAGSIGDVGIISNSGQIKNFKPIKIDTLIPHFRALAINNNNIFVLNVGNPALLYKLNKSDLSIVYTEKHEKVFYDSMKFFDNLNGIALGDPTDTCLSVLITANGGNFWTKIPCENLPKTVEGEAAFAASNTNIAIFGKNAWLVSGGNKSRVFHTSSMGKSWKVYETPVIQGKSTAGIYTVDFYNKKQGIICGGDFTDKFGNAANKAITKDGGKNWEVVSENKEPHYVSCVQYVPNTKGKEVIAVSTSGIFYSKNAGRDWAKISNEGFYTVRMSSKNTGWLSGNEVIAKFILN
ncbi:oxidoreductase [Lutibacter sp.]|uniref:sialidase family protein n=1 Tax=Lutibacter sp. TaxID=1925666 RepID=UPI002733C050|nr:oxidoreductase [Lutibacter sp.]MDP3313244.1 oxidoreductase [Lutibacter sp.]